MAADGGDFTDPRGVKMPFEKDGAGQAHCLQHIRKNIHRRASSSRTIEQEKQTSEHTSTVIRAVQIARYRCAQNGRIRLRWLASRKIRKRSNGISGDSKPGPAAPVGVNHIVLNVRNMDESHQFWTEVVGLRLVGEFRQRPGRPPTPRMRFYSGTGTTGVHHHDLALVENPKSPVAAHRMENVGHAGRGQSHRDYLSKP